MRNFSIRCGVQSKNSKVACLRKLLLLPLLLTIGLTQSAVAQVNASYRVDQLSRSIKLPLECQYRIKVPVYQTTGAAPYPGQVFSEFAYLSVTKISADGFATGKPVIDHFDARLTPYDVEMMLAPNLDLFLTEDWRKSAEAKLNQGIAGSEFFVSVFISTGGSGLQLRGESVLASHGNSTFYLKANKAFLEQSCNTSKLIAR